MEQREAHLNSKGNKLCLFVKNTSAHCMGDSVSIILIFLFLSVVFILQLLDRDPFFYIEEVSGLEAAQSCMLIN